MAAVVAFGLGELSLAGTFFLLPFAIGAVVACILAFAGVGLGAEWIAFVGVSLAGSVALFPLRRRLDRGDGVGDGVGARRLLGQAALVVTTIEPGPHGRGMVRIGREEWRAESEDAVAVDQGAVVRVVEVRGTGVVVTSTPENEPRLPPSAPPTLPPPGVS